MKWRKASRSGSNGGDCVEVAAIWRKASRSGSNGGACVEVAAIWQKASRSTSNGGACVEVARTAGKQIAARDSKQPAGPHLRFETASWETFLTGVKSGRYDL